MSYAILRTAKLKTFGNIGGSLAHNYRTIDTPNADPNRADQNIHGLQTSEEVMQRFKDRIPEKRRSDAVLAIEYLITASPEWEKFKGGNYREYFVDSLKWLAEKHGEDNIVSFSIHEDETTPHLVAYVVPLDDKGKLNCKSFLGGRQKLREMQTDFAERVGKQHGLERGIEGSKAKHKTIKKHYQEVNDIENSAKLPNKYDIVEPKVLESKKDYAHRACQSVAEQLGEGIVQARRAMKAHMETKEQLAIKTAELKAMSEQTKHYRKATEGLLRGQVRQIDRAITEERDVIEQRQQEVRRNIERDLAERKAQEAKEEAEKERARQAEQAKIQAEREAERARQKAEREQKRQAKKDKGMSR